MAACQLCLKLVPGQKSPQVIALVTAIMDWLESTKNANQDNDGITNQMTAQAVVEEYCLKIFEHADSLDKQAIFDKYVPFHVACFGSRVAIVNVVIFWFLRVGILVS